MTWLDPRVWLALLISAVLCVGGGYQWGKHATTNAVAASASKADHKVATVEATRAAKVEAIGVAASTTVAVALNTNQVRTDESTERIRTVLVPADCRDMPAAVMHELSGEADRINAQIRSGLRPGAAGADPPGASD